MSLRAKPTACDTCRKGGFQCDLDNYVDDCGACTSLGIQCFVTDDYNVTVHKVPQRTLHKFQSAELVNRIGDLGQVLHNYQSNGEITYAIINEIVSKFEGVSEEALNYQEVQGFLAFHFSSIISWFKNYPDHQVWYVARHDQKTMQSLKELSVVLKLLHNPRVSRGANWFAWQIAIIESEEQDPSDSLPENENQTQTSPSNTANGPERMPSADIQDGESYAGELQDGEPQDEELQARESQAGEPQAGELQDKEPQAGESQAGEPQDEEPQDGEPQVEDEETKVSTVGCIQLEALPMEALSL
ncbi:hypothetical protein EAE96_004151 [Botrytis aclada]|nr:hypothetical protein EAE96_004151 [Botrytis aclada]